MKITCGCGKWPHRERRRRKRRFKERGKGGKPGSLSQRRSREGGERKTKVYRFKGRRRWVAVEILNVVEHTWRSPAELKENNFRKKTKKFLTDFWGIYQNLRKTLTRCAMEGEFRSTGVSPTPNRHSGSAPYRVVEYSSRIFPKTEQNSFLRDKRLLLIKVYFPASKWFLWK